MPHLTPSFFRLFFLFFCLLSANIGLSQSIETNCGDGIDNDGDGLTDCADVDCEGASGCENAISCEEEAVFYQIIGNQFIRFDPFNNEAIVVNENDFNVNGIGYNIQDGFIYGIRFSPPALKNHLVRVGANGVFEDLGLVAGLPNPEPSLYYSGDIDDRGQLYSHDDATNRIYQIDIETRAVVEVYPQPFILAQFADMTFVRGENPGEGKFYCLLRTNENLYEFDQQTGIYQNLGPLTPPTNCVGPYGSAFSDLDGQIYFFCNTDNSLVRINPENLSSEIVYDDNDFSQGGDGASCMFSRFIQSTETNCGDGIDNDGDGLTDCADVDCEGASGCENAILCEDEAVFFKVMEGNSFARYIPGSGVFDTIFQNDFQINAMGYNTGDGFIYGIRAFPASMSNHLVRVGLNGVFQDLGDVSGLPTYGEEIYISGGMDIDGNYYVSNAVASIIYQIDIETQTVINEFVQPFNFFGMGERVFVLNDDQTSGKFYTYEFSTESLYVFDPSTGIMENLGVVQNNGPCGATYGAGFSDRNGDLYFFCNNNGDLLKIDVLTLETEVVEETGVYLFYNDGASCPYSEYVIRNNIEVQDNQVICEGENYLGLTTEGFYTDTTTLQNGVDSIWTLSLRIEPTYSIQIDTQICANQGFSFYSESGRYIDTFKTTFGCDSVIDLTLDITENPSINLDTVICSGGSFRGYTSTGTYVDILESVAGCDTLSTLNLTVLETERFLNRGPYCDSLIVNLLSPNENTIWNTGQVGRTIEIDRSGMYSGYFFDERGCIQSDTVEVILSTKAYVPNAFSPNLDGINDYFKPYFPHGTDALVSYEMKIYDRWGGLITDFDETDMGWDGTNEKTKKPLKPGVFVYELILSSNGCPEIKLAGDVMLIR